MYPKANSIISGYGNVAPQKVEGQLFVILYGLFGVPFTMVVIANLGKFLAEMLDTWIKPFRVLFKKIHSKLCKRKKYSSKIKDKSQQMVFNKGSLIPNGGAKHVSFQGTIENESIIESIDHESLNNTPGDATSHPATNGEIESNHYDEAGDGVDGYYEVDEEEEEVDGNEDGDDEEDEDPHKNAGSLFICFVLYLIIGSVIIASYEPEMDVFKAIYYTFVSLTTIGLGDVVPKRLVHGRVFGMEVVGEGFEISKPKIQAKIVGNKSLISGYYCWTIRPNR